MRDCLTGLKNSLFLLRVCQAMYRLNRRARGSDDKQAIYRYKGLLIRWLYEHGHCEEVRRQDQILPCWHTWEYNNELEDVCRKCGNSDIYKRIPMYRFVFRVESRFVLYTASQRFVWHQPADMVDWPVQETGEPLSDWEGVSRQFDGQVSPAGLWAVRWFLVLHGLLPIGALALVFSDKSQSLWDEKVPF